MAPKTKERPSATTAKHKYPTTQMNKVGLPSPTTDDLREGIIFCYGLKPVGQLYRAVILKIKDDEIIERIENIETTRALQIGHISKAMDIPGFGRQNG